MNVIFIHGKDSNPNDKWYPWLKEQMEKRNIKIDIPEMPDSDNPKIGEWIKVIENLPQDENTILAGHSRGGVAILRYLEKLPENIKFKKIILLAANSGSAKFMAIPTESNYGFYTKNGYDFEKIKSHCSNFVVFHSKDDKWVPFKHGQENANKLNAKFITFENKGHFGRNDGIIPELIDEITNN